MILELGPTIGQGGYGQVRYAHKDSQPCAVKTMHLTLNDHSKTNIQREAYILQRLRHPHIIQFYSATYHHGQLYIIMEYAERGSLTAAITKSVLEGWEEKERIAQEVVRGLAYIHSAGVLHRDLKSDNVLLDKHKVVKLCDFGLAVVKSITASKFSVDGPVGTPRWMAPELFDQVPKYSIKSDIYALGWIMWEMAANSTRPFKDHTNAFGVVDLIKQGVREKIPAGTPDHYREQIELCWHQDPELRPEPSSMVVPDVAPSEVHDCSVHITFLSCTRSLNATLEGDKMGKNASISATTPATMEPTNTARISSLDTSPYTPTGAEIVDRHAQATSGDMHAQFALGMMYSQGDGIQSAAMATLWFLRAAEQGHAQAQFQVGQSFELSPISGRDIKRAVHWYSRAAAHGHTEAKRSLEAMVQQGLLSEYPADAHPSTPSTDTPLDSPKALSGEAEMFIDDIERLQSNIKHCRWSFAMLFGQWKGAVRFSQKIEDLEQILKKIYLLALKLTTSGLVLLSIDTVQRDILNLQELISRLLENEDKGDS